MSSVTGWMKRGHQTLVGRLLLVSLVIGMLSPSLRAPGADAQDLTPDDEAWIEQRIAEAGIYVGGGFDTPNLQPEDLPEFETLYRNCLTSGLLDGNSRSATLDLCAENFVSYVVDPQEWFGEIDDIAVGYLDELNDSGVEPFAAAQSVIELRDCLKGLARTRFLDLDEALEICNNEAANRLEEALRPPTPTPTPTSLPTSTPIPTPALPAATPTRTPGPVGPGNEVIYRADQNNVSGDNAHLTFLNAGPVDTKLFSGTAEMRVDSITGRMRAPARLSLVLVAESTDPPPICSHVRFEMQGNAPISDGSVTADEGMILNFDANIVRTFDGPNCPPEKEFRSTGVLSLRAAQVQDPESKEDIIAFCSLALSGNTREDCARAPIALLRAVR